MWPFNLLVWINIDKRMFPYFVCLTGFHCCNPSADMVAERWGRSILEERLRMKLDFWIFEDVECVQAQKKEDVRNDVTNPNYDRW